jgi:predicted Zn-dependent peptidase
VYYSGLNLDYYTYYSNVVRGITADHVQDIAQKYLGMDEMVKVVVGNSFNKI